MALATRPKRNTSSHKKRSGKHHRRSDTYLKTYWPYLPMLLIVGAAMLFNGLWNQTAVLGTNNDFTGATFLSATNQQRTYAHESPLTINQQLNAAAQAKANDMVARNYWSHNTPDGQAPWSFITKAGYSYQTAGENLAYGFDNATDTVAGWMNSSSHRANILNANYKDVGFGIAQSPDFQGKGPQTIIVAEYGNPAEGAITATGTAGAQDTSVPPDSRTVSRIQLMANGQAAWTTLAMSALAGAAIATFLIRHGLYLKRLALQGERFVLHHPALDISLIFIGSMALIFVQASGFVR